MKNQIDDIEKLLNEKPINWREILEEYLRYWKWIVFSMVFSIVVAILFIATRYNLYEFEASVLILDQNNSQMSEMSLLKQLNSSGLSSRSSSSVNNEEQVISSKELMKRVVNELEFYNYYYYRKYLLKHVYVYTESPYHVKLDSLSLNNLKESVELSIDKNSKSYKIKGKYQDIKFDFEVKSLPVTLNTPVGRLTITQRMDLNPQMNPFYVEIFNPVSVTKYLTTSALETQTDKLNDVILLKLRDFNEQRGKDVLNTLIRFYNQDAIEQVNRAALSTAQFIDERMSLITGELKDVEKEIETYKKSNELTNIDADAELFLQNNSLYMQQQVQIDIQLQLIRYIDQFMKDPSNKYAFVPNLGLTDVGLVAFLNKYNELIMSRDRIVRGSSENNPTVVTLNQQIETSRAAIQKSVNSSLRGMQISSKGMTDQSTIMQSRLKEIPRQEREFLEVKRQQQVKESLYMFLLQKREEASLSMAIASPKGRILNMPDESKKVAPRVKLILSIFLFFGLLIPVIVIRIKHLVNTSFSTKEEVEKLTNIPIITMLSHNNTEAIVIDHNTNANANAELFRLMRTKLQFALDHPKEKVILITSTQPGEGKTFVSINLSISLSLSEKKVLLIGLDLRKPMLTKQMNLTERDGITSYLSGIEADYKKFIFKIDDYPHLSIMPAGVIPPNPNELLMKDRLDTLINELKAQYDYIIIDSAPVGSVSDTFLLNRITDITMYVCRANYSDKRNIEYLNKVNEEKSLKQIYLIVNDVDFELKRYYNHGYGYGYGKK